MQRILNTWYSNSIKSSALVAYSAVDGDTWIYDLAQFLNCDPAGGNDASTSIDLYGLNNYELCGNETFDQAYQGKTNEFAQRLDVAAYFSEYGCVKVSPRPWADVAAQAYINRWATRTNTVGPMTPLAAAQVVRTRTITSTNTLAVAAVVSS